MSRSRVFLDANVLFSAAEEDSALAHLVERAARVFTLITSDVAVAEARRNLGIKFPQRVAALNALLEAIVIVSTAVFRLEIDLAQKDLPLLCTAIRAQSDYFVTGDRRDFGQLWNEEVHGTAVINPLRLTEILVDLEERDE